LVDYGFNKVVGTNKDRIVTATRDFLESTLTFNVQLYGSGNAGQEIVAVLDACSKGKTKGK